MTLPKILVITVLVFALPMKKASHALIDAGKKCEEIKVLLTKTDTTEGLENGSITIELAGDRSEFAVYMLTAKGKTKLKSSENSIRNLKKGKHSIVITGEREGSNYCQKFFEVVIN